MGKPQTVEDYFNALLGERREPMENLAASIRANLPGAFEEVLNYGQPSWVVPHSLYEAGYHANPELPLPFLSIASQKSHIAVYHMDLCLPLFKGLVCQGVSETLRDPAGYG